jgi:hypothetical protein
MYRNLGLLTFVLGFLSVFASIATWAVAGGRDEKERAHGERFGIFVGLWAPTFFALSQRLTNIKPDVEKVVG